MICIEKLKLALEFNGPKKDEELDEMQKLLENNILAF